MPLRPDLRNLRDANGDYVYRGATWKARRERLLERCGHACERCRVPHGRTVIRSRLGSWKFGTHWYSPDGTPVSKWQGIRTVRVVLDMVHLTHDSLRNQECDLGMLCKYCHFNYDGPQHKETRQIHKDARRPLLAGMGAG